MDPSATSTGINIVEMDKGGRCAAELVVCVGEFSSAGEVDEDEVDVVVAPGSGVPL